MLLPRLPLSQGMLAGALHILASASALSNGPSYQVVLLRVLQGKLGYVCQNIYEVTVYIYIFGVGCGGCAAEYWHQK